MSKILIGFISIVFLPLWLPPLMLYFLIDGFLNRRLNIKSPYKYIGDKND